MRRLRYKGNDKFIVETVSDPSPGPNEVVVSPQVAALCGSDLHIKEQHDVEFAKNPHHEPKTPSHEPAGTVVKIGIGVTNVKVGDRVAVYHKVGCMACESCNNGEIVMCDHGGALSAEYDGAAADLLVIPKENCLPLPQRLSFEDGAIMMCAGGTAYSGLMKAQVTSGETVAVFGCGPVGLATIILAKAMGAKVYGVDISESRLEMAKKVGATGTINSKEDVLEEDVYDMIHGFTVPAMTTVKLLREYTEGRGVNCVIECSASKQARINGIDALARHGRMVLLGISNQFRDQFKFQQSLEPEKLIFKELKVFGSNVFPLPLYHQMVRFMVTNNVSFSPMITHRFPLEEGEEAFRVAALPTSGKVIISWE
jgi:threonine dehydrogenase-like Zn-dependent dehydrogenase